MRLISYNIHKGIGGRDRRYRVERVIDVIEGENPDLIFLQEVDRHVPRSRRDDQPRLLARHFRVAVQTYQLNVHLKEGGYGNLLLSRWPFASRHRVSLRRKAKKPRGAILAVVRTPEGPLHVVNWHLGLADRERRWQVKHLLEHPLFRESEHLPTLLVGDTNDWRDGLGNGPLAEAGFEQVTHPKSRFKSFPAYMPISSLDKAFFRGDVTVRRARIVRSRLAKLASDHLPLVVDFHLAGANPLPRRRHRRRRPG